ncbi:hypothetical protein ACIBKX_19770 [Streptomyces sp. NPDC050658]|uniref:hypothetical protein n=1 Tax=unclassified Streptomyces TaxID=2593676 RepID=UPI003436B82C
MISNNKSFISTAKMTDRSVVASCLLGFSNLGTGLSGGVSAAAVRPESAALPLSLPRTALNVLPVSEVIEGSERATKAPGAVATAQAQAYAFAAGAGAGAAANNRKPQHQTTTQHHTMWAFRGLEPWSDPV